MIVDQSYNASTLSDSFLDIKTQSVLESLDIGEEVLIHRTSNGHAYSLIKLLATETTGSLTLCNIQSPLRGDLDGVRHVQPWDGGFLTMIDTRHTSL